MTDPRIHLIARAPRRSPSWIRSLSNAAPGKLTDCRATSGGTKPHRPVAGSYPYRPAPAGSAGASAAPQSLRVCSAGATAASGHQEVGPLPPARPLGHRQPLDQFRWHRLGIRPSGMDDHSQVAFGCIEPKERGIGACRMLMKAGRHYRSLSVRFARVLTDNGACYKFGRLRRLVRRLGMRHLRNRPYTLRTNGKAERLVQTRLRKWTYARPTSSPDNATTPSPPRCITTTSIAFMPASDTCCPSHVPH